MIFSVATQKGGVGKTTTSVSLAAGLAHMGKHVLLIDMDSQANASKVLLPHYEHVQEDKYSTVYATIIERKPVPIHKTTVENLDIVPSHILISNADVQLALSSDRREDRLKRELDTIRDVYQYVIIDCPPSLGWLTINALTASDGVLVTVAPGYFELDSIAEFNKTISLVQQNYNPGLKLLGYLFVKSQPTVNSRISLQILRQAYTSSVLNTVIPSNVDISDANFQKKDIFSHSPRSTSALAYMKLIKELFYE